MKKCLALSTCALALGLVAPGCSTQTMYESTKAWQRNECQKLQDKAERDRCLDRSNASYDSYRQQAEGVKKD